MHHHLHHLRQLRNVSTLQNEDDRKLELTEPSPYIQLLMIQLVFCRGSREFFHSLPKVLWEDCGLHVLLGGCGPRGTAHLVEEPRNVVSLRLVRRHRGGKPKKKRR
jgi:hypothetical protein